MSTTKPPGIFTPFSCNDLGDYSELNWEALDGGPVLSHPMVTGVSHTPGPGNPTMPSTFQIRNSGPVQWHQPTNSTTHDAIPNPIVTGAFWSALLPRLETVDHFVRDAMRLKRPTVASAGAPSPKRLEMTWLRDRHMTKILETELPDLPDFQFSEHVNLFLRHFGAPEFKARLAGAFTTTNPPRDRQVANEMAFNLFSSLAMSICAEGHSAAFKKLCTDRQGNINENIKNYCDYVDAVLARNLVLQVLRIDLTYNPASAQDLSIDQARDDMNRFQNNLRHKKLFAGQRGYIWKMENSNRRGLHFHLISFFANTEAVASQQQSLAQQIGEYWMKVTGQRGCYQDCSQSDYPYKRMGIGMLNQNDIQRRADLHRIVTYLCKRDQALSIKDVPVIHHGRVK